MSSSNQQNVTPTPTMRESQPGLEVDLSRFHGSDGLQPVPYDYNSAYGAKYPADDDASHLQQQVSPYSPGLETVENSNKPNSIAGKKQAGKTKRKRYMWIAMGLVAVLAVGGILGGVLGSRAAQRNIHSENADSGSDSSSSGDSSTGGSDGNSTTTTLQSIRRNSRLAVSGWRDGSNFRVRLFYQGPDQALRSSIYTSADNEWSSPIALESLTPRTNTSLAAVARVDTGSTGTYNLFYVDESLSIRGQTYQGDSPDAKGTEERIDDASTRVSATSRLAAYWPFLTSQDQSGDLRLWFGLAGSESGWTNGTGEFNGFVRLTMGIKGSTGAGMAMVPANSQFVDAGGLIYVRDDGKLSNYMPERNGTNFTGLAWGQSDRLSFSVPDDSPIGAFSYARDEGSDSGYVNTHILYQDDAGAIKAVWQDDNSGSWKGPNTYDAFEGADVGTDIACLTPGAWNGNDVLVSSDTNMNRCYFQVGGRVREVLYDGEWRVQGFVPMS